MKRKSFNPALKPYIPIIKGLAQTLGRDCEVLLHDVQMPESSVVACENAHVTGRSVGAPMTAFGCYMLQSDEYKDCEGIYNYTAFTDDGRKLKCSVFFIRDAEGALIGLICLNMDISRLENMRDTLNDILNVGTVLDPVRIKGDTSGASEKPLMPPAVPRERFYRELDDVWDQLLQEIRKSYSVPLTHLTPQEMESAIERLNDEGFFLVKGAIQVLAHEMNKSRYTIYGYLRKIRARQNDERNGV